MRLLDLDGRFLRVITAAKFRNPQSIAVSHGKAYVLDEVGDDYFDKDNVLHVIDIQSDDILQSETILGSQGEVSSILVDGDEIYYTVFHASEVAVLQFAGGE